MAHCLFEDEQDILLWHDYSHAFACLSLHKAIFLLKFGFRARPSLFVATAHQVVTGQTSHTPIRRECSELLACFPDLRRAIQREALFIWRRNLVVALLDGALLDRILALVIQRQVVFD